MNAAAMVLAAALPLALAPLCLAPATRRLALVAVPWAAVPALALALGGEPGSEIRLPAVLLGMRLALDPVARTFLLATAVIALLGGAALHAMMRDDPRRFRFAAFYLAGVGGNVGTVLAHDIVTFYSFFALMTFAAYGLVIHAGDTAARRAAGIYLVMVVLGEALLLGGLAMAAATGAESFADVARAVAASSQRHWIFALLLAGFGVKAGLLPWHVSLPPAYAAAPVAGGVLLGGAMIHVGLLGWLRLLPFGIEAYPQWGALLLAAGIAGMYYGVVVGLLQTGPKAMLAYSSISQMGFMLVALGLALREPRLWPLALAAVLVYVVHHALVKSTLFLGVGAGAGRARRPRVIALLAAASLMLAGFPFTTGAVAKLALQDVVRAAGAPWTGVLGALLSFGALGTALLLLRFLAALGREPAATVPRPRLLRVTAAAALAASVVAVMLLPQVEWPVLREHWREPAVLWHETWPVLGALALAYAWLHVERVRAIRIPRIAPGDLVVPLERAGPTLARVALRLAAAPGARAWRLPALPAAARWPGALQRWSVGSLLFLLTVALLLILLGAW